MAAGGVQGFFDDRFVRNYDRCIGPLERTLFREARARLAGRAGGKVLDLGAGTGANFEWISSSVRQLCAVDFEPRMLVQSRRRECPVEPLLAAADAECLPFASRTFDTVLVALVLCTIKRPADALAEIARVLVPGGRMLMLEHVRSSSRVLAIGQDLLTPLQRLVAGGCNLNRRTEDLVRAAGFRVERRSARLAGMIVEIEAISPS